MSLFIGILRKKDILCFMLVRLCMNSKDAQCKPCGPNLAPNADFEITSKIDASPQIQNAAGNIIHACQTLSGSFTSGDSVYACLLATITYTVTVTDKNGTGISATATSLVAIHSKPDIKVLPATICSGACDTIYSSGVGAGGVYTWLSPLNGNTDFQRVCPVTTTTYSVTGTDAHGCKDTAAATVTVNSLSHMTVPDAGICPGRINRINSNGEQIPIPGHQTMADRKHRSICMSGRHR